jgi:hypothetical protein
MMLIQEETFDYTKWQENLFEDMTIIADAKAEGDLAVVGFPVMRNERYEWDCTGPIRLYEEAGFAKTAEAKQDERVTMRKELKLQRIVLEHNPRLAKNGVRRQCIMSHNVTTYFE